MKNDRASKKCSRWWQILVLLYRKSEASSTKIKRTVKDDNGYCRILRTLQVRCWSAKANSILWQGSANILDIATYIVVTISVFKRISSVWFLSLKWSDFMDQVGWWNGRRDIQTTGWSLRKSPLDEKNGIIPGYCVLINKYSVWSGECGMKGTNRWMWDESFCIF